MDSASYLSQNGFEIVKVLPDKNGKITADAVSKAVDDKTVLVSVMLVNNEIGAVNDVATIAAAARRKNSKIIVHCDAVQAFGKIPVNVGRLGVDLLSITAHKIHGPKGIGALYVKNSHGYLKSYPNLWSYSLGSANYFLMLRHIQTGGPL